MFYPSNRKQLETRVEKCFAGTESYPKKRDVVAGVVPHAGYEYSCHHAAQVIDQLFGDNGVNDLIVVGFDHDNSKEDRVFLSNDDTPFGLVTVNKQLARQIAREGGIEVDSGRASDHSIWVQYPLIQHAASRRNRVVQVVPVAFNSRDPRKIKQFAVTLSRILEKNPHARVIASSDLFHEDVIYTGQVSRQHENEDEMLEKFISGEFERKYDKVQHKSICGAHNILLVEKIADDLECSDRIVTSHDSSCQVTNDKKCEHNVGYAGLTIGRCKRRSSRKENETKSSR